jgi:poly(3-hydroxybutyrate) depolymerase
MEKEKLVVRIELKTFDGLDRDMYVVYPAGDRLSCYENTIITILREDKSDSLMKQLVADKDFENLVDSQRFLLLLPNPVERTWNWEMDDKKPNDLEDIVKLIDAFNFQPSFTDAGIYHTMHNARYFVGEGTGASMIHTLASVNPVNMAGALTIRGDISPKAMGQSKNAAVPAILWNATNEAVCFMKVLNKVDAGENGFYFNKVNDCQMVYEEENQTASINSSAIRYAWEHLFSKVCRFNSCSYGEVGSRTVRDDYKFIVHENDTILGDNHGIGHTWFEYVPETVKKNPDKLVPLLIFNHGGSDTPGNMCNNIKMEKVAEKEGFIMVYPWSTSKWGWNMDMEMDQYDDVTYLEALIKHMKDTYAIDETRVYMSGFSNGSAMSQVFAMVHPETVAAVFANNTRFCQNRNTLPFMIAGAKKLKYDYRMPVWYHYSSRDYEYPVVRGSGQQVMYDFWKSYNNITVKETPYVDEVACCGVGVPGDKIEEYYPNTRYPERKYTTHRFYSNDECEENYYNYTLVDGKGHDNLPEEAIIGWNYIKQFRRMPDGSIKRV